MRPAGGRKGFTFPELMIVTAIMAVTSVMTLQFLAKESDAWQTASMQSLLYSELQEAMSEMNRELRNATRAAAGAPPNIQIIAANNLRFYLPADANANGTILDATGNIEWDAVNAIDYIYNAGALQLRRTVGGATRVVANGVTAVVFETQAQDATLMADEVRVTLTVQGTTQQNRVIGPLTARSIVRLRN